MSKTKVLVLPEIVGTSITQPLSINILQKLFMSIALVQNLIPRAQIDAPLGRMQLYSLCLMAARLFRTKLISKHNVFEYLREGCHFSCTPLDILSLTRIIHGLPGH